MARNVFLLLIMTLALGAGAQPQMTDTASFLVTVLNEKQQAAEGVTIELIRVANKELVKAAVTDTNGTAAFSNILPGEHYFAISAAVRIGERR